jgi:tRNA nucleotidyltransferase/poly(A) polymerase
MIMAGILKESEEITYKMKLPEEIEVLNKAFKDAGHKLYVVGGAVRDAVLGKTPKDYDVTTKATPEEVVEILNNAGIRNFPKGEAFGVVSAIINGEEFEIATFRSESYDGSGRRPTEVEYSTIDQDSNRRDLTINALYYDIDENKIIDFHGGVEDIKGGRIRTVGNPEERFYEDRLRIMRAIRFKNITGGELDNQTKKAILKFKDMPGVSGERIRDEFYSGLKKSKDPKTFLSDLYDYGIMKRMFPDMNINTKFSDSREPILVVALLLKDNDPNKVYSSLTKAKYTNEEKKAIKFLLKYLNFFKEFNPMFVSDVRYKTIFMDSDSKTVMDLLRERGALPYGDILVEWSQLNGLSQRLAKIFNDFEEKKSKDIPEIQQKIEMGELPEKGREIGDEARRINFARFLSMI